MKKFYKVLMILLCLCPIILLAACKGPEYFSITAKPSDWKIGRIEDIESLVEREEGSKVTLKAKEIPGDDSHPFICWIKDNKKVVSTSHNYTLTYSAKTQGEYTAVFDEDPSSMLYAILSNITVEVEDFTSVSYNVKYAMLASGSDSYTDFANGSFNIDGNFEPSKNNVLYFGKVNTSNEYKFDIQMTLSNTNSDMEFFEYQLDSILDRDAFGSNATCTITQQITSDGATATVTFEFTKINYSIYH